MDRVDDTRRNYYSSFLFKKNSIHVYVPNVSLPEPHLTISYMGGARSWRAKIIG